MVSFTPRAVFGAATLAAVAMVASVSPVMAATDSCISLSGSTMCPSFSQSYINPSNLTAAYPFFADVTDVTTFDTLFASYYTQYEQFRQTKLHTGLQCNETATLNATLQWSQTVLCGLFGSYSYNAGCTGGTNQSTSLVCRDTCTDYSASEYTMVANASYCTPTDRLRPANLTTARNDTLVDDYDSCTSWTSTYSTDDTECILGISNEGNCGFGPGVNQQLCSYCNPSSGSSLAECCYDEKTHLGDCGSLGYPAAALIAAVTSVAPGYASTSSASSSASSTASSSSTGAASASNNDTHLTGGQIAGIVVGVIAFVIIGAIIFFLITFCCLGGAAARKRRRDGEAQYEGAGILAGGAAAGAASHSPQEKSYHMSEDTNRGRSLDNEKNGSSPMGGAAGGAMLGAGAGALAAKDGSSASRPMSQATSGTDGRGTTVASVRCQYTGQTIAPGDNVVAIYPYSAGLSDELDLAPESHEQLTVVRIYDDGWCLLRRSPDNGSTEGAAPLVCCQSSKGELPAHMRPHGESGTGTGSGTTDEETGLTSGAEGGMATSSVGGAVTADEYGFTSDAASR